jgi:hypothetical protein
MVYVKPLPNYLIQRYHGWKATTFEDNHAWYRRLASEGQRPRAMVISCCDSRVHVTAIFGAEQGEFSFIAISPIWCRPIFQMASRMAPRLRWNMRLQR